ncbi:hypothetical protein [Novosphingobium sp. BL-52-GroH]
MTAQFGKPCFDEKKRMITLGQRERQGDRRGFETLAQGLGH